VASGAQPRSSGSPGREMIAVYSHRPLTPVLEGLLALAKAAETLPDESLALLYASELELCQAHHRQLCQRQRASLRLKHRHCDATDVGTERGKRTLSGHGLGY
jgi:hypothetical protein